MAWYVLLDGQPEDAEQMKRLFKASHFVFDEIDGKFALNAPEFALCSNQAEVIDAAMELATAINTTLRLSVAQYSGVQFWGLVEKREDGSVHRTMFAKGGSFGISGAAAVGSGGPIANPVRTREEKLASLMRKSDPVADIAVGFAPIPAGRAYQSSASGIKLIPIFTHDPPHPTALDKFDAAVRQKSGQFFGVTTPLRPGKVAPKAFFTNRASRW